MYQFGERFEQYPAGDGKQLNLNILFKLYSCFYINQAYLEHAIQEK